MRPILDDTTIVSLWHALASFSTAVQPENPVLHSPATPIQSHSRQKYNTIPSPALTENASIFHILEMALGFSSTQDFAAASRGKNP